VEAPQCHRAKNPVDQEAKQPKQKNINDNQQPSEDKLLRKGNFLSISASLI
jgi:hypothetical protein